MSKKRKKSGGKRKISIQVDRIILKLSNAFMRDREVRSELNVGVCEMTARRRPLEEKLPAYSLRKKILLTKKSIDTDVWKSPESKHPAHKC